MTTAEAAPAALGPRYAPDDPTLPTPWKGLIDGSTGLLYYWNPETNITQYEKPAPLPLGPAPAASTPNLAPIPAAHSITHGGMVGQHGQQLLQSSQQQGSHLTQQHGQIMPQQQSSHVAQVSQQQPSQGAQAAQQQNSQMVQSMAQPGLNQAGQQVGQPQGQHLMQPQGQHSMQPQGQQMTQQQIQQMHYQMQPQAINSQHFGQGTSQAHGSHIVQPQAHQFAHQNMHYMSYQPNVLASGQQNSQQIQHNMHGHRFENQQDFKAAFPKKEEVEFKNESQVGVSPSKYQQRNVPSVEGNQNIPAGMSSGPSGQVPHAGVNAGQPKQFTGLSGGIQQSPSAMPLQHSSSYSAYQHGPSFQNQMGPGMMHGHPPNNVHPVGQKMGHGDNLHGGAGNEYYYNSSKEMPAMGPQQPNIAQVPISTKQQVFSFIYSVNFKSVLHFFNLIGPIICGLVFDFRLMSFKLFEC